MGIGSTATDAGDPDAVAGLTEVPLYDHRGKSRVANRAIVNGAVELVQTVGESSLDPSDMDGAGAPTS